MRTFLNAAIFVLLSAAFCSAQDPLPVVGSGWQRTVRRPSKPAVEQSGPARAMIAENRNFERGRREVQSPGALDPNDLTIDGRSAALDKAVQESRASKTDDIAGYDYTANVRNDSGKTIEIVFWEYRFTEIARPQNVVRRQFLCAVKLKKGDTRDLPAFSQLGPSEVIGVETLAKPTDKMFDEKVLVNRVEFADGSIMQRNNWKYEDVQKDVRRVTSTPWGKEICRAL